MQSVSLQPSLAHSWVTHARVWKTKNWANIYTGGDFTQTFEFQSCAWNISCAMLDSHPAKPQLGWQSQLSFKWAYPVHFPQSSPFLVPPKSVTSPIQIGSLLKFCFLGKYIHRWLFILLWSHWFSVAACRLSLVMLCEQVALLKFLFIYLAVSNLYWGIQA